MTKHSKVTSSLALALALIAALAMGCQKGGRKGRNGSDTAGGESPDSAQRNVDLNSIGKSKGECDLSTVYFDFDSSELDDSARQAIQTAVECYRKKNSTVRLHLTGAADPLGTEEYNLALGERRAQSVQRYLISLGIESKRVSVSSVGEETASGTDESSWALDRNVKTDED